MTAPKGNTLDKWIEEEDAVSKQIGDAAGISLEEMKRRKAEFISNVPKSRKSRGWYIRRATGEIEVMFLSKERAENYISKDRSTDPRYKGAKVEFIAE